MYKCETCGKTSKEILYGTGRFCCIGCRNTFAATKRNGSRKKAGRPKGSIDKVSRKRGRPSKTNNTPMGLDNIIQKVTLASNPNKKYALLLVGYSCEELMEFFS